MGHWIWVIVFFCFYIYISIFLFVELSEFLQKLPAALLGPAGWALSGGYRGRPL